MGLAAILVGDKIHRMPHYHSESIRGTLCPWHTPRGVWVSGISLWPCWQSHPWCLIGRGHSSRLAPFISTNGDYWELTNFNASCRGTERERGEQEMSRADVGE